MFNKTDYEKEVRFSELWENSRSKKTKMIVSPNWPELPIIIPGTVYIASFFGEFRQNCSEGVNHLC